KWDGGQERWDYVGPTGSDTLSIIATLDEIAAEPAPREPNFFEMLRAGILEGTLGGAALGQSSGTTLMTACPTASHDVDASLDLHVLKIGAGVIDSADADNFPTILALQFGAVAIERAGTEDLPYLYCVGTANARMVEPLPTPIDGKTHRMT